MITNKTEKHVIQTKLALSISKLDNLNKTNKLVIAEYSLAQRGIASCKDLMCAVLKLSHR